MSKWGLNGAPMHLSCLSLDPSSRRSGTLTLLMPPTSLCYGQEYCHGRYIDSPFVVVVIMIYIINTHGVIRLAGALTPALQRKYFTMIYMTVSTMTLYQVHHMPNAHLIQDYPISRGHAHIAHAEDVSAPLDFVPGFLESSVLLQPL